MVGMFLMQDRLAEHSRQNAPSWWLLDQELRRRIVAGADAAGNERLYRSWRASTRRIRACAL